MTALAALHARLFCALETRVEPLLMPALARLVFAGTLLIYFWNSGLTKLGEGLAGLFAPSFNAYVQILPRMSEAVGYDASQIPAFWRLVVLFLHLFNGFESVLQAGSLRDTHGDRFGLIDRNRFLLLSETHGPCVALYHACRGPSI